MKIRPGRNTDLPLVMSSWLRSYRDGFDRSDFGGPIPCGLYYEVTRATAVLALGAACAELLVACSDEHEDDIIGWSLTLRHKPPVIVYVYVKPEFHRLGYGSRLLAAAGALPDALAAFWTPLLGSVLKKHWAGIRVRPRTLRGVWFDGAWYCCHPKGYE